MLISVSHAIYFWKKIVKALMKHAVSHVFVLLAFDCNYHTNLIALRA